MSDKEVHILIAQFSCVRQVLCGVLFRRMCRVGPEETQAAARQHEDNCRDRTSGPAHLGVLQGRGLAPSFRWSGRASRKRGLHYGNKWDTSKRRWGRCPPVPTGYEQRNREGKMKCSGEVSRSM